MLPTSIPYMPAGEHIITATVNGAPGTRRVVVDAAAAARLQADLATRLAAAAARQAPRPVLLFDHSPGAAAAYPKRFSWSEGKGVLLEVDEWSAAGREAVEGRNYGYISPCFRVSRSDGQVLGLADGPEVGSLVNDPAFQRIDPILDTVAAAAAYQLPAGDAADVVTAGGAARISTDESLAPQAGSAVQYKQTHKQTQHSSMDPEIIKLLGLPEDADTEAALAAIRALMDERGSAKKEAEELAAACRQKDEAIAAARAEQLDNWLTELKTSGRIAPQDEEAIQAASALFAAAPAAARAAYAKIPPAKDAAIIQASNPTAGAASGASLMDFIEFPAAN